MVTTASEHSGTTRKLDASELNWLTFEHYELEIDSTKKELLINAHFGSIRSDNVVYFKGMRLLVSNWSKAERISSVSDFSDKGCLASLLPEKPLAAAQRSIELLQRSGSSGGTRRENSGVEATFLDSEGFHCLRFEDACLDVEATVFDEPSTAGIQITEQRTITRRLLSDTAISQLVCDIPGNINIINDEISRVFLVSLRIADFGIMESPILYNVKVKISNWSSFEKSGRRGGSTEDESCSRNCCCALPFLLWRRQLRSEDVFDLTKLGQKSSEIKRIHKFNKGMDGSFSFDVVLKEVTLHYSFHGVEYQVSADCDSSETYEYFDLLPHEIYQVFLDQAPVEAGTEQEEA